MRLAVALVVLVACGSERGSPQPEPKPEPEPQQEPEPEPAGAWAVRDFSASGESIRAPVKMLAPPGATTQVQQGADGPIFLILSPDARLRLRARGPGA